MESSVGGKRVSDREEGRQVYLSYLLRMWRMECGGEGTVHTNGRLEWRASLESARTGERVGFGSLEELFSFLHEQLGIVVGCEDEQTGRRSFGGAERGHLKRGG